MKNIDTIFGDSISDVFIILKWYPKLCLKREYEQPQLYLSFHEHNHYFVFLHANKQRDSHDSREKSWWKKFSDTDVGRAYQSDFAILCDTCLYFQNFF